jgi:hypothetical protein
MMLQAQTAQIMSLVQERGCVRSWTTVTEIDLPEFTLTKQTLVEFQTAGSIEQDKNDNQIPSIVRFAFRLTHALGERCWWYNHYCIMQDNTLTVEQVLNMDKIHGGSYRVELRFVRNLPMASGKQATTSEIK